MKDALPITPMASANADIVRAFKAMVRRKSFPCLGAKSALKREALDILCAGDIVAAIDDQRITRELQLLAEKTTKDETFISKAILFPRSSMLSESEFEAALWQRLRAIHVIDRESYGWDDSVSDDPQSPHFSMSVGGRGYFIVGLHPGASRLARRFRCPVMVFNLHSQFEQLRADGLYEKLRDAIIERDIEYSGSKNPMLATHGDRSQARQYSGRQVSDDWVCPFSSESKELQP
ncbi:MAG: guanitoxin biosynthesis heme-dependent pre-guanitoxin N-hydroxylase GntA [Dokdonella sp.]